MVSADGVELFDRHWNMRATLVPLLARAAPALRPSMGNRASSSSRSVAVSAKGSGKKAGDAKGGYGGEASVGEASGGQTSADAATAAELKDAGIKVILGSKSFTRKAILKEMGIEYTVAVADIDEKAVGDRTKLTPKDLVMAVACAKADAIVAKMANELGPDMAGQWPLAVDTMLVTCDQVVVHEGKVREKPESVDEARSFITSYGESPPSTVGAIVVTDLETGERSAGFDGSTVAFAPIPDDVVDFLVEEGECMNCAGGLMVEHPKMSPLITEFTGSMDSIMGLGKRVLGGLLSEALLTRRLKGLSGGYEKEVIPVDQRIDKAVN